MPRSTGLPSADAQSDFARARRRTNLRSVAAFLRREPDDVNVILPFDEVVRALGMVGRRSCGFDAQGRDGRCRRFRMRLEKMRHAPSYAIPAQAGIRVGHGERIDRRAGSQRSRG